MLNTAFTKVVISICLISYLDPSKFFGCASPLDLLRSQRFEIMEKLCRPTSKSFLKIAGEMMHTSHPNSLDPLLAISYRNHQKSLAYFSHLAPIVLLFFTKRQNQKGEAMVQCPPNYVPVTGYWRDDLPNKIFAKFMIYCKLREVSLMKLYQITKKQMSKLQKPIM